MGLLRENGELIAKEDLDAPTWAGLSGGVREFQLQGNFIGALQATRLRVKFGIASTWNDWAIPGGEVRQFRPVIDVAHPPIVSDLSTYLRDRPDCVNDAGGAPCYDILDQSRSPPSYGRYCGFKRPENWDAAQAIGPFDALDGICKHHDFANDWYAAYGDLGDVARPCIVHFGLIHATITRGATRLATGSDYYSNPTRWNEAWRAAGMPRQREGVEAYLEETSGCDMELFHETMGAKNR